MSRLDIPRETWPTTDEPPTGVETAGALPQHIGRHASHRLLAQDEQLQRRVAIKVPHARLVAETADAEAYLAEARTVASLDHPNIVPVHDVGSTSDCPCYVVSKYIDGADLATKLRETRPSQR